MIKHKNLTDDQLFAELSSGTERGFDQIFDHFYAPLHFFAQSIVHDPLLAEDTVQELLLKVWQRKEQFNSFPSLKSYLYTGVKNSCLNQIRNAKVKDKHRNTISEAESVDDQNVLYNIIRAEVVSRIFAAVDTLPEQCRKVIRMTFDEDKKPKEIAEELGISISTVNNHKMRGLSLLKERLSDQDYLTALIILLPVIWR